MYVVPEHRQLRRDFASSCFLDAKIDQLLSASLIGHEARLCSEEHVEKQGNVPVTATTVPCHTHASKGGAAADRSNLNLRGVIHR